MRRGTASCCITVLIWGWLALLARSGQDDTVPQSPLSPPPIGPTSPITDPKTLQIIHDQISQTNGAASTAAQLPYDPPSGIFRVKDAPGTVHGSFAFGQLNQQAPAPVVFDGNRATGDLEQKYGTAFFGLGGSNSSQLPAANGQNSTGGANSGDNQFSSSNAPAGAPGDNQPAGSVSVPAPGNGSEPSSATSPVGPTTAPSQGTPNNTSSYPSAMPTSDLRISPPPSPILGPPQSMAPGTEGGVRIAFDQAALAATSHDSALLTQLEGRLAAARNAADLNSALSSLDDEVAQRIMANGEINNLSDVTAVSLKSLCTAAADYSQHWDQLPESLRHPGSLRRLYGFMITRDGQDLIIFGSRVGDGTPIDIDDLIVGLQNVWREGATPICSLDPDPANFGGPQKTRIEGVPSDSHFARVMLDADYAMKIIALGARETDVPGFMNMKARIESQFEQADKPAKDERPLQPPSGAFMARFWFTPVPPAAGEIRWSKSRRAVLFNSRMQVLTEDLVASGGMLSGTGQRNPLYEDLAKSFSQRIDRFEQVEPLFCELHGLFDITLLASLLRHEQIDTPVLHDVAKLPTRHTPIPATYQGLSTLVEKSGFKVAYVQGGVRLRPVLGPTSVVQIRDPQFDQFVDRLEAVQGGFRELSHANLPLFIAHASAGQTTESNLTEAATSLANGDPKTAHRLLTRLLQENPDNVDAYLLRSDVYVQLGFYWLAERDLLSAELFGCSHQLVRIMRISLQVEQGRIPDAKQLQATDRRDLAALYLATAVQQMTNGKLDQAAEWLGRVIKLIPDQAELYAMRGGLRILTDQPDLALTDLDQALKLAPRDGRFYLMQAGVYLTQDRLAEAKACANKLIEIDPNLSDGYLVRAAAQLGLAPLKTEEAFQDIRLAERIDPKSAKVKLAKAKFLKLEGDREGALAACNRALELEPGLAEAYVLRITLRPEDTEPSIESLEDANTVLIFHSSNWQAHSDRAQILISFASDGGKLREFTSHSQFSSLLMTCVSNFGGRISHLARLKKAMADGEHLAAVFNLKLTLIEVAQCDLEAAAAAAPSQSAERLKRELTQLKKALAEAALQGY